MSGGTTGAPLGPANDLADLGRQLDGRVILPDDPTYDSHRVTFNAVYDYVRPAAIVQAASVRDVQQTVVHASHRDIELVVRSGGHSFIGASSTAGIVLDISPLASVTADTERRRATVGAGIKTLPLVAALVGTGLAIPSGWCPTVGVGGLTLGGGIGKLTRMYGLTCDNLRRVELVLADGSVVQASEDDNADLFWACRGGGGGNFGVATEFEFELRSVEHPFCRFNLSWPWDRRAELFGHWQEWSREAPNATTGTLTFSTAAPGSATPIVAIEGVYIGPTDEAERFIADLERRMSVGPAMRHTDVASYFEVEKDIFAEQLGLEEAHWSSDVPAGKIDRYGLAIKSEFVKTPWPDDAVDVITAWIEQRQRDTTMTREPFVENLGKVWFEVMGGAMSELAPDATAFVHRDAELLVQFQSRWTVDAPPEVDEANIEWLRGFYDAMAPWRSGSAYVNYADHDLEDWAQHYYGANHPRLQAVKRAHDPHNLFSGRQSITPA